MVVSWIFVNVGLLDIRRKEARPVDTASLKQQFGARVRVERGIANLGDRGFARLPVVGIFLQIDQLRRKRVEHKRTGANGVDIGKFGRIARARILVLGDNIRLTGQVPEHGRVGSLQGDHNSTAISRLHTLKILPEAIDVCRRVLFELIQSKDHIGRGKGLAIGPFDICA